MSPAAGAGGGGWPPPTTTAVARSAVALATAGRAWRRCAWLNEVKPGREGTGGTIRSPRRGDGIGPTAQRW
jgi:hypothetical protein